ncbi:MAG: hypothetical protein HRT90_08995, partial [Candidatus Margulisbacteria bacterium]|nr:hypothetical protein [Candidatus Margulisiibacteriota bacterium]
MKIKLQILFLSTLIAAVTYGQSTEFNIALDAFSNQDQITGRLYVALSKDTTWNFKWGPNGSTRQPVFAMDLKNHSTLSPVTIGQQALHWPDSISINSLEPGLYQCFAFVDVNNTESDYLNAEG